MWLSLRKITKMQEMEAMAEDSQSLIVKSFMGVVALIYTKSEKGSKW